jgi:proteasome beta subunit
METELKSSMKTGTTILGIVCKDGVVMAADRRGTIGNSIIYNKDHEKVLVLNDYLLLSGCGSSTEIQKISRILKAELRLMELKSKVRPTIREAVSLLSNIPVQESAFILGGIDKNEKISLYDILGGRMDEITDYTASVGSGMPFAIGLLERQYKKDMNVKDGVELAQEAIKSSTQRDVFSGNGIDVFTITKDGIKKAVDIEIKPNYD